MNELIGTGRRVGRGAAGLAVLIIVLSVSSFAQSAVDPELAAAIAGKKKVRVLTPSGPTVLRRPAVTEEGLAYHVGSAGLDKQRVVRWADVRGLQIRRSGAGKGALIGAGIGAGLGLALGLASTRDCTGFIDMFCEATAGQVALVTAIGGAGGGLIGAGIGALTGRWGAVHLKGASLGLPRVSVAPARGGGFVFSLSVSL